MNPHHDRDRKIFEVFVRENEGALMAYIRTFTRDAQIAEDLFQETMLIAWRKFDEFDSRESLSAWLRGIAKNLIRNAWRKQSNDRLVFDESTANVAQNTIEAVEMQGSDTWLERLSALSDCISRLPARSRELVTARYADKRTADELALSIGISAEAVRKRLQRIREQLADCIERYLGEATG
ncbi:MAG: sigma-70 family RNA polymerase sigma factor [Rubripirellula sp.]|nr:sigma-70 family RNA polymerase sigma factor [Rubripirellula sp.]